MKKCIGFILFFLISFTVLSQSSEKKHKWSISGFYYPEYSYRFLMFTKETPEIVRNYARNKELPMFGYSYGLNAKWQMNKRLGIKFGMDVFNMGFSTRPFISEDRVHFYHIKLHSYCIPVMADITLFDYRGFSASLDIGLAAGLGVDREVAYSYWDYNRQYTYSTGTPAVYLKTLRIFAMTDVMVSYQLKRFSMGLAGGYKMSLTKFNDILQTSQGVFSFDQYFYSLGGGIVLSVSL